MVVTQQQVERFVNDTLTVLQNASISRVVVAGAFLEVAGTLMRQEVEANPTTLGLYAELLQKLEAHVLGPMPAPLGRSH